MSSLFNGTNNFFFFTSFKLFEDSTVNESLLIVTTQRCNHLIPIPDLCSIFIKF